MFSDAFPTAGDHFSGNPGFFQENPFLFTPPQEPVFSLSGSGSGSDNSTPEPNRPEDDVTLADDDDERKRRRMISNRESARRSRMRKQKHLENLRRDLNRFRTENKELRNRLRFLNHHGELLRAENRNLGSESVMLQQKLWDIRQVLLVRQLHDQLMIPSGWPCNNNNLIYEQNPPSIIT